MVRKARILTGVDQVRVTVAVLSVVHDHARSLHERVADGRPDKGEAGLFQGLAHGLRLGGNRRHFAAILEVIDLGHAADKRPEQSHGVLQRQPGCGIAACGVELQAVSHNAWVLHQRLDFSIGQLRQALRIKAEQDLSIMLAFA